MRYAHRGVGLVDVLTAGAGGTKRVDADVRRADCDVRDRIGLRQHRNRACGSVNASLRLGFRHPLHTMAARLELELRIDTLAGDARDDLLETAHVSGALRDDLNLPVIALAEAGVHAE